MSHLNTPVSAADHHQGPLDAAVVLVEYGDFECPYCGEEYPELKAVQQAMGAKICFVFRNFPLNQAHPHAQQAAEFSEAAATAGKFWQMHDLLYENQEALDERSLVGYATQLGLGKELIEAALRGDFTAKVRHDFTGGVRSGVNGTPCLFINGQRYDGERDAQTLLAMFHQKGA